MHTETKSLQNISIITDNHTNIDADIYSMDTPLMPDINEIGNVVTTK